MFDYNVPSLNLIAALSPKLTLLKFKKIKPMKNVRQR